MRYKQPLRQILMTTRSYWDRSEIRPAVRENFDKVTKCRTLALERFHSYCRPYPQ
jgi:hypothetical protein